MTRTPITIIGTGWAASMHATAAARSKTVEVVRVVGRRKESAQRFAREFRISSFSDSLEDIPEPSRCSGIVLCVPPSLAPEMTMTLVQRGHKVLVEKPGAVTADCLRTLSLMHPDSSTIALGYQLRHDARFKMAKKLLGKEFDGGVSHALLRMLIPERLFSQARRPWQAGAIGLSVWVEAGVHLIDIATWLFGPCRKHAALNVREEGRVVTGTAHLEHESGAVSILVASVVSGLSTPRGGLEVFSKDSRACLVVDRGSYKFPKSFLKFEAEGRTIVHTRPADEDGTLAQLQAFGEWQPRHSENPGVGLSDGLKTLTLAEKLSV